jgi:hypothetical protein
MCTCTTDSGAGTGTGAWRWWVQVTTAQMLLCQSHVDELQAPVPRCGSGSDTYMTIWLRHAASGGIRRRFTRASHGSRWAIRLPRKNLAHSVTERPPELYRLQCGLSAHPYRKPSGRPTLRFVVPIDSVPLLPATTCRQQPRTLCSSSSTIKTVQRLSESQHPQLDAWAQAPADMSLSLACSLFASQVPCAQCESPHIRFGVWLMRRQRQVYVLHAPCRLRRTSRRGTAAGSS